MAQKFSPPRRQNELLVSAVSSNDLDFVKKCVEQGADINSNWPFGHHSIFTKAVENGHIDIVRYMIRKKAKLQKTSLSNTYTPLIVAIRSNFSLPLVELLVESGADVDERDVSGRTPLNEAIALNKDAIVEYLLIHGANVNQADGSGRLPVTIAVRNNRVEIVKFLVIRGADVNRRDSRNDSALTVSQALADLSIFHFLEDFSQKSVSNYSPRVTDFIEVIGTVEEPEETTFVFISKSSNNASLPDQSSSTRQSRNNAKYEKSGNNAKYEEVEDCETINLIDVAILNNNLEELNLLLQDNVNQIDNNGLTALAKAIGFEKPLVVKFLLTLKADTCKIVNGKTPLHLAVERNNLEIIKLLMDYGAEHTIQTAFFEAISLGNLTIINFFIERGAEVNLVYKNGYTPLMKSLELRNFEAVKLLVENGANVNMPDGTGRLPLLVLLETANSEMVSYFCNQGATLARTDFCKLVEKYIEDVSLKMLNILVEVVKVDIDFNFECGFSLLTKSVEVENLEIVQFLLNCNPSGVNKVDGNDKTALAVAAKKQNLPMVKFLISAGADVSVVSDEIEEYANLCEDFALYLDLTKGKYTQWKP